MSVSPTNGIGPTQGQRKTLTRVGIEPTTFGFDHRCSPTELQGHTSHPGQRKSLHKLIRFALIILLHFALILLHFALVLHFAAIITFCGVTGFTPVGDSENYFSEYFDLRTLLCFLLIIQGRNPFII